MPLKLSIITPEGQAHQGEAGSVTVPAFDGELGIHPLHAPLIGRLGSGELRVKPARSGPELHFFVSGGFVQVLKDEVTVLATRAEAAGAFPREKAEEDLRKLRAEPLPPKSSIEARAARQERIRQAQIRLKVASRARA